VARGLRGTGRALIVGNSDGIGLALTRRMLAADWTVAGLSRSDSDIRHDSYTHRVADVTAADSHHAVAECADGLGDIDVCVYSAGIGEFFDVADLPAQTRTLDVNLMGAARTVEVVVPRMVAAGRGHVVGLSSLADAATSGLAPAYAASKAALSTYFRGLTLALRPHGVAVTTVRFGFVDTKMAKADTKPGLITAEKAVDVVVAALGSRRAVVSYPRTVSIAARLLSVVPAVQLRVRRTAPPSEERT
jgi:NAD(P)-dependent dehydrogenase (short-subunit alcohol dehydrogenase family)